MGEELLLNFGAKFKRLFITSREVTKFKNSNKKLANVSNVLESVCVLLLCHS